MMDVSIKKFFLHSAQVRFKMNYRLEFLCRGLTTIEAEDSRGDSWNQGHTFACLAQRHTFLRAALSNALIKVWYCTLGSLQRGLCAL